jgi:outer membrane protein assembly factor BamD
MYCNRFMKNKITIPFIAVLPLLLSACSSSPDDELINPNQGIQVLYDDAKNTLRQGNFTVASQKLSSIDSRFPFGPLSHQVQLDLIYSHYKSGQTDQALASIDRFMRLNPNHSDVDYALYMRGLVNMDTDKNLFQQIVGIDRSDRDPFKARESFEDFRRLIEKYPESKYAADAARRMSFIKNRLAKYELSIARYYVKRGAYVAAANRGQHVVEHYSDSQHLQEALEIMVKCYDKLELDSLKENAEKTLALNFPQNS